MRIGEVVKSTIDLARGPKIEGKVAAIFPSDHPLNHRYAVRTEKGIVDAHFPSYEGLLIYFPREPFKIGERLALRAARVKPWVDGQII